MYDYLGTAASDPLIHMNGRIYDGLLGRFLSADIQVTDASNIQCYNRYSYVRNNPLSLVDKDGFKETVITPSQTAILKDSAPLINREVNRIAGGVLTAVKEGKIHYTQTTKVFYKNITKGMDSVGSDIGLSRKVMAQGPEFVQPGVSKGSKYDGGVPMPSTFPNGKDGGLLNDVAQAGALAGGFARINENGVKVWQDSIAFAPGINVGGNAIGTDKLDHMFEVGGKMKMAGCDAQTAAEQSVKDEAGQSGVDSSGVFSNGDIAANVAGVEFYAALEAAAKNGTEFNFNINDYNVSQMDEHQNPNGQRQTPPPDPEKEKERQRK